MKRFDGSFGKSVAREQPSPQQPFVT